MKKLSLAVLILSIVSFVRADITTGLVGYWSLSDGPGSSTAADTSGNNNTGTLLNFTDATYNNMWTSTTDPHNGWPFALLCNQSGEGANTYVNIPDAPSLNTPSANKAWTLSAWVNCSVAGTAEPRYAGIISKGARLSEAFVLYMNDTSGSGKFTGRFWNNGATGGELITSTTVAAANTWYHVVVTVQEPLGGQTSESHLYINGALQVTGPNNNYTTMWSTNSPVTIGCRMDTSGTITYPFSGTLDDVRVYNRALSASDVTELYNNKAFILLNNGIGLWNGLSGSGGSATLDTTSLNFCTNLYTAPVGTAGKLADVLSVEQANSLPPGCAFADAYYSSGSKVAVASTNLTIASGGVALGTASAAGTMTFLNAATTYILNSSDSIGIKDGANPTSLVQSGNGTVILTGINTFSGGVTISSGTLQLGNGGTVTGQELGTATAVTDNGALVFDGNNSVNFSKTISGTGSVTDMGSGTLTLNTANTYSGGTTISNGTVQAASLSDGGTSALGTGAVTLNNGTLLYTGTSDTTARQINATTGTTNTLDVPSGVTLELSGAVTSAGTFTVKKTSAGTLTLSGTTDNAHLTLAVNAGKVILNKTSASNVHALGGGSSTVASGATLQLSGSLGNEMSSTCALTVSAGGVLDLNAQDNTIASLSVSGTGIGGTGALINSAALTGPTLTVPITLAGNTTMGGAGNITLPGVISGTGSLTYSGSGLLLLEATNTYSGDTIISSGTLDGNVASSIPGNVTISGTGVLQLDNNAAMSSVSSLTLPASPSAGVVNLNFSGSQTIAVLMIGSTAMPAGTYGASATNPSNAFTGAGLLVVTGQADWDPGHAAASPGSGGTGNWDTTTSDWFTGSGDTSWPADALAYFAGSAGTVTLAGSVSADGLTFATPAYNVTNTDGVSVLTLDGNNPTIAVPAGNTTISCTIAESGANPVTVTGPGTLSLSGANTYTGGTMINGATLSVNAISDVNCPIGPSGTVTLVSGGTLAYTGAGPAITARGVTASGPVTCYLNVPAGNLEVDGQVRNGGGNSAQMYTKTGSGTVILGGAVDNPSLTMAINQGTVLITKASASNVHGLGGGTSIVGSGATLQLSGSGNSDLYSGCILTVNSGGLFDLGGQSDIMSTLTISGTGLGSGALINSVSATTSTLTNNGSGFVLAGPTTVGGPGNIVLAGKVSGTGPITYAGTGNLTLTNANTYTGGTVINANGTVTLLNAASAAGTDTITDNGTLGVGIVPNNAILANAITGSGIVNLIETSGDNLQLGGSMSGFTGMINCPASASSAKVQILTAGVGLTSAATINVAAGGTLYVANTGVSIPGPLNLYGLGNSESYGVLRIENGAVIAGPVTLYGDTTMGNGQTGASKLATISGPISQSGGSFGITFTPRPGIIVLSATNTYSGATTISGGVLMIGGAGELGSGNYAAPVTNNATFDYASSSSQTLSGAMAGTGTLVQSGPGALSLSGTSTFSGGILITNGSPLTLTGSGCLGVTPATTNYPGAITNYGTLTCSSSAAQTWSGVISGTGTLTQSGSGTLTLSGANTYTGGTLISSGSTLALGVGGSINGTPSISLPAGATLDVSAYSSYALLGSITLTASGTGTTVGATAAAIKGSAAGGATVTLASPLALTFTPLSFAGDATHPALYIAQISLGQLILSSSTITVNNAGASPLGAGTYSLIQVAAGGTISAGTPSVTVTGHGLVAGATASISVSGGSVNLVVSTTPSVPAINNVMLSGADMVFSGTNGTASGPYYVLTSTNVALPLTQWKSISTNNFVGGAFSFTATNAVGGNSNQFFRIKIP